jgi:phage-related protein
MTARKPVEWIGSSQRDLRSFPKEVRRVMGQAVDDAQLGAEHPAAKALKGFGGRGVLEIVDDFDGGTFRAVYTVRFAESSTCCTPFRRNRREALRRRSGKST